MTKCTNCHKNLSEGLNFCPYCGEKISYQVDKVCPSCNLVYSDSNINFCGSCGTKLVDNKHEELVENNEQTINSLEDLVHVLNSIISKIDVKANSISIDEILLYSDVDNDDRYDVFYIPKKKKKEYRMVASPTSRLKLILRCLNELLYQSFSPSSFVTGFVRNKTIVDNGRIHVGQRYLYTIDLNNFFESVKLDMIVSYLCQHPYNFNREIANVIAQMSCVKNDKNDTICLAQGSPLSPILSNIVCIDLDRKLNGLSSLYRVKYSRYADDLTFSSYNNLYYKSHEFTRKIKNVIEKSDFKINYRKIHVCGPESCHYVTGMVTNTKVNVPRKYIKSIRNLLYIWANYGINEAYTRFDAWYQKMNKGKSTPFIGDFLRGRIEFLGTVRGKSDTIYKKFKNDLSSLMSAGFKPFTGRPYNFKVYLNLSKPIVKYGQTYYTATSRRNELVLISPKLNDYIESDIDDSPAKELSRTCLIYKIFDKDGVKFIMSNKI